MKYAVEIAGRVVSVEVTDGGVVVDGRPVSAALHGGPGDRVRRFAAGGRSLQVVAVPLARGRWRLQSGGERLDAVVLDERARAIQALVLRRVGPVVGGALRAPMPGLVVRVLVAPGEAVGQGQGLIVVEAMKMENELKAAVPAVVLRVHVAPGAAVEKGALLVEFGPPEA